MALRKCEKLRDSAIKNINRVIANYETSITSGTRTKISASNSLETAKKYYKVVEDNHETIITSCAEDVEESHTNIFANISDKFENFQNSVEQFLLISKRHEINNIVNLPAQELPKFDGDPRSWTSFCNTFSSMIGENPALSGIQRFRYLIGCLEGVARNTVLHIPETEEAFDVAWELLRNRYQDRRFIILTELERLTSLTLKRDDLLQFITEVNEITRKLAMLGEKIEYWDSILLHIISKKLPANLVDDYENSIPDDNIPPFANFLQYIEKRAKTIYKREFNQNEEVQTLKSKPENRFTQSARANRQESKCFKCNNNHPLDRCGNFLKLNTNEKWQFIRDFRICSNCLRHKINTQCKSEGRCRTCGKRHHTLLHLEKNIPVTAHLKEKINPGSLLATSLVNIKTSKGSVIKARALLDSGAQVSLITSKLTQLIGSTLLKTNRWFKGINQKGERPLGETSIAIMGLEGETIHLNPLVVKQLTTILPEGQVEVNVFKDLVLADAEYTKPGPIDMILGMDVYNDICLEDRIYRPGQLTAQRTIFGWIISGPLQRTSKEEPIIHHMVSWEEEVKSFWDVEAVPTDKVISEENKICEELYMKDTYREKDGRYVVRLPFKNTPPQLGKSEGMAVKRLQSLERKFHKNPQYAEKYREVIHDYLKLGHLEPVPFSKLKEESNYLPHHAVIKEESFTTKCRVVFDASAKTTNGKSLNDELLNGEKLQQDIFYHLLRFRQSPIAITADIEKMYRQIKLHPDDRKYQRIVWRDDNQSQIRHYQLTTVTFGLKSAPFLAIRTLHQISNDYFKQFPLASKLLKNNFYVDNLLLGVDSDKEATQVIQDLNQIMKLSGLHLRQWASNSRSIIDVIPEEDRGHDKEWTTVKTLGFIWNTTTDTFQYKITKPSAILTKRSLLSIISGIYDPMGYLSPITIKGKVLFQHMWTNDIKWDDPLPEDIKKQVGNFIESLPSLRKIKIPRHAVLSNAATISLHLFTDASEKAYAAVAYVKSETTNQVKVQLLTAKTKVAPLKPLTVPKLELTAMVLATKLLKQIMKIWKFDKIFAYSDSKIALAWVQSHPSRWTNFVANRVAYIQETISATAWYYIKTTENPADLPTRGCEVHELWSSDTWWNGPPWLSKQNIPEQKKKILPEEQETIDKSKRKGEIQIFQINEEPVILNKYSSYIKLQRVIAFILRWKYGGAKSLVLTTEELKRAEITILKIAQRIFHDEISSLTKGKPLKSTSSILSLSPFVDKHGILRVGGRLQNSGISGKHPCLIPKGHIGHLLLRKAHHETMHGGPTAMLSQLRQKYWVIGARNITRKITRECPTCLRLAAESSHQIMAPLPTLRVTPSRPFTTTAIDYAGPINIKAQGIRTTKTIKAYIVVFVCFSTKAVHLELVTDLSTNAFIAALRRFVARRGKPSIIYSDNGTNFVGADNELRRLATKHNNDTDVQEKLSSQEITWQFMPPRAPHMGGLHEAAVKAMKKHLLRIVKDRLLNYEELSTVLTQIEGILNSRPLTPLSLDPNDPIPLTPGHFLIGGPMNSPPDPPLDDVKINHLSRWQLIQKMNQDFWNRWSREYLSTLQFRTKWNTAKHPISTGDVVIIKDPQQPPFSWKLGLVQRELPGKDGITRVVQVKTSNSICTRNITSLIKLHQPTEWGGRLSAPMRDKDKGFHDGRDKADI